MKTPILLLGDFSSDAIAGQLPKERYDFGAGGEPKDALGLIVRSQTVSLSEFPRLAALARAGVGVDNIPIADATEAGIPVFFAPSASTNGVAELVFAALGAFVRKVPRAIDLLQGARSWHQNETRHINIDQPSLDRYVEKIRKDLGGHELAGKRLGVVGLGRIGVAVANVGIARGMRVFGCEPNLTAENAHALSSAVARVSELKDLWHTEIVSVHVPLTAETRGLVGDGFLRACSRDGRVALVNFSRAGVCDEDAVRRRLDTRELGGYVTDFPPVWHLGRKDVLALPHLGASTQESQARCGEMVARALADFFERGVVQNSVNFPTVEPGVIPDFCVRIAFANRNHPGMLAKVLDAIAAHGFNVAGNVHRSNGAIGYGVIDIDKMGPVTEYDRWGDLIAAEIRKIPDVLSARRVG